MKNLLLFILLAITIPACDKPLSPGEINRIDVERIEEYLAANNLTAVKTLTDLHFIIHEPGGNTRPFVTNEVKLNYEGFLLTGEKFDSSFDRGEPLVTILASLVPGFQEGVTQIGIGGSATLLLPSRIAYGEKGQPGTIIGENEPLRFEVELLDFN